MQKNVRVQSEGVAIQILLFQYMYSYGTNTLPPAWRSTTPSFWLVDPTAFNQSGAQAQQGARTAAQAFWIRILHMLLPEHLRATCDMR